MLKPILALALALTIPGMIGLSQSKRPQAELVALVEAERNFSRTCVAKGLRVSFMEFFADDGIRFLPHPVNALENFRQSPAPPGPQSFTLSWEPVFADVSQAGDLGFTTGPYVVTDNAKKNPSGYGYYFSIWQKQHDGSWKVLLDYGTAAPAPASPGRPPSFKPASSTGWHRNEANAGNDNATVLAELDRQTAALSGSQGITATFRRFLISDARFHRGGMMPLEGQSSILDFLDQQQWTGVQFEPVASGLAQSADLGYSYGKYSLQRKNAAGALEKGYYVRVWKRDERGQWKIAMDVANALPPETPAKP